MVVSVVVGTGVAVGPGVGVIVGANVGAGVGAAVAVRRRGAASPASASGDALSWSARRGAFLGRGSSPSSKSMATLSLGVLRGEFLVRASSSSSARTQKALSTAQRIHTMVPSFSVKTLLTSGLASDENVRRESQPWRAASTRSSMQVSVAARCAAARDARRRRRLAPCEQDRGMRDRQGSSGSGGAPGRGREP